MIAETFKALNVFNMPSDVATNYEKDCANRMVEWMKKDDGNVLAQKLGLICVLARK